MALVECRNCGKKFNNSEDSCPECGCKIAKTNKKRRHNKRRKQAKLEDYIILYFDVLGYKNIVTKKLLLKMLLC